MNRRAFTLIELLIVIAILGVLAGLMLPAVTLVRRQAKSARTVTQIESLTSALQRAAAERDLMSLLTARSSHHGFTFPPTGGAIKAYRPGVTYRTYMDQINVEAVALADFSPDLSGVLMHWSGLMPQKPDAGNRTTDLAALNANLATYATDRDRRQPWIDAWGNPLTVACLAWKAELRVGQLNNGGLYTVALNDSQGRNSFGLWISVASHGAAGPLTSATVEDRVREIWDGANQRCDPDGEWAVEPGPVGSARNAVAAPPWQGVRVAKGAQALLAAPVEIQ